VHVLLLRRRSPGECAPERDGEVGDAQDVDREPAGLPGAGSGGEFVELEGMSREVAVRVKYSRPYLKTSEWG
jgi:hypothetical protein